MLLLNILMSFSLAFAQPPPKAPATCDSWLQRVANAYRALRTPANATAVTVAAPTDSAAARVSNVKRTKPTPRMDADYLKSAAVSFTHFFSILSRRHIGYESALQDFMQAVIAQEPVALFGPGGNGKSFFASIIEYIVDEETGQPEFVGRNFGPDTSKADMVGPLSPTALMNENTYVRLHQGSIGNYFGARIEEFFDASPTVTRAIHEIYDDRDKRLVSLVITTNKTMDSTMLVAEEKYADRDLPRPTLNRFPVKILVPRDFPAAAQYLHMFHGAGLNSESPLAANLSWQKLIALNHLANKVEIPLHVEAFLTAISEQLKKSFISKEVSEEADYKRNKKLKGDGGNPPFVSFTYFSKRAMMQSARLLQAAVVLRNLGEMSSSGQPLSLKAEMADIQVLAGMAPAIAADFNLVPSLIENEIDPRESLQTSRALDQINAFQELYQEHLEKANEEYAKWGFAESHEPIGMAHLQRAMEKSDENSQNLAEILFKDLREPVFTGGTGARLKIAADLVVHFDRKNLSGAQNEFIERLKKLLSAFQDPVAYAKVTGE